MMIPFTISEKQKKEIQDGNFVKVMTGMIRLIEKHEIMDIKEIEGPFSNGNKEIYLINCGSAEYQEMGSVGDEVCK